MSRLFCQQGASSATAGMGGDGEEGGCTEQAAEGPTTGTGYPRQPRGFHTEDGNECK